MLLITPDHRVILHSGPFKVPIGQGQDAADAERIAKAYHRLPDLGAYDLTEFENETGDDGKWMQQQAEQQLKQREDEY